MYVNIINSYRTVVAICDDNIIGKTFQEGNRQIHVKESFYKGDNGNKMSPEEISKIIRIWTQEDATFNIVGEESVKIAIDEKIIDENSVERIEGIPYTMVLL